MTRAEKGYPHPLEERSRINQCLACGEVPVPKRLDEKCDASHDGHDCAVPGACQLALSALCERVVARRERGERDRPPELLQNCTLSPEEWRSRNQT